MEPNETSAGAPSEQNDATMQNDSNMTAETPSVDVAVGAEAIVASEEIAESGKILKDDTVGGMMAGGAEPKKNGKGMLIGMVLFALLAAGGIGFGVWTMMDGNNQVADANKKVVAANQQVDELKKQNEELTEKLAKQEEKAETKGDTSTKVDTADYIYVGEWGLKIKIPEGLRLYEYSFEIMSGDNNEYSNLAIYAGDSSYPLGVVTRYERGYEDVLVGQNTLIFSDDKYGYYISGPNGDVQSDLEDYMNAIITMLRTKENYSAI